MTYKHYTEFEDEEIVPLYDGEPRDYKLPSLHWVEPSTEWRNAAACRDKDVPTSIFFDGHRKDLARAVCARCPEHARIACLTFAVNNNIEAGIYGGLDYDQRKPLVLGVVSALTEED